MQHNQPDRSADRSGCAVARTERIAAAVHADLPSNRTVDNHKRRSHVGRCLHTVQVEGRVGQCQRRSLHNGRVFRLATRYHHVDGEHLDSQHAPARRHTGNDRVRIATQCLDHGLNLFGCRRHDRQTIGPTLLEIIFD